MQFGRTSKTIINKVNMFDKYFLYWRSSSSTGSTDCAIILNNVSTNGRVGVDFSIVEYVVAINNLTTKIELKCLQEIL